MHLDTLFECIPFGLLFLDLDLRFLRINKRLAEINGVSVAEHIGKTVAEILPSLVEPLLEVTARILATGQPVLNHEFSGETASAPGVTRHWNESWYPVRDERGEIVGFGAVVEDVTERRQAEAALRLKNDRFELAVKASTAVLYQQDLELRFTWLHNPAPGIDGSDAVGKREADLLERAEDVAVVEGLKREVIRSGVGMRTEFFPQIQGKDHCFELLMEPLRNAAGHITGLTGAALDITERKNEEAARRESDRYYRSLADASLEIPYRMSADWATMLPLDGRGLVATSDVPLKDWAWLEQNIPREDHDLVRQAITNAISRKGLFELEHRVLRPDGSTAWVRSRAVPLLDEKKVLVAWFGAASEITDRKHAEERLRLAIAGSDLGTWHWDIRTGELEWSERCLNIFGLPARTAMSYEKFIDAIHPEDRTCADEAVQGALRKGSEYRIELRNIWPDGSVHWALSLGRAYYDDAGKPTRMEGIALDITERKRVESALLASSAQLQLLETCVSRLNDIVLITEAEPNDQSGPRIVFVNDAFVRRTGFSREEVIGKTPRVLQGEKTQRKELDRIRAALQRWEPVRAELINYTKAGQEFWLELDIVPVANAAGWYTHWVAVEREITDRKKEEQASLAAAQYSRSLIEASLDPLVTISTEGKITDANTATEQVTGVRRESLIGSDFADYFIDPQKAREGYQVVFSQGSVTDYPLAIRHASGKITDVLYNASLYRDAQGNVLGAFAAARDITESKRLEQTLQMRNVDLETATAVAEKASLAKSNFLSSMSHELRTPLNAILGFAQLIESSTSPPTHDQKRSIDQILSAGWYLLELVNEILDLAQIESGKVVLSREAVPLAHLMSQCMAMVEPLAHKRGIEISLPRLDRPHYVYADPTRTRQVLINLLHNAIKYNKPGGKVTVECAHTPSNSIRISVRDTGLGLSPEQMGQLFQPFNRLGKEAGPEEGTGIGLVVVKRLVEMMGGTVGVESQIGVGSIFWIELNLTTAALPTIHEEAQDVGAIPKPPKNAAHRTVLYVEDNPANLALMEELIMRRPNLSLISAADGNLGVEYARTYLPEVILMDLHLPGISGIEAMKILRSDPTTAHIPIIAISAYALEADIKLATDAGCFKYIAKPIKLNEFMIAMDVALRHSQSESARVANKA
jgi:PAS domain S-box-containing protein